MTGNDTRRGRSRRAYLAGTGTAWLATLSGCLNFGNNPTPEFSASPAQVAQSERDETDYELDGVTAEEVEREFETDGQSKTAVVTNQFAEYHKPINIGGIGADDTDAAVFTVVTTPQVNILDRRFNPVDGLGTVLLSQQAQSQYEQVAAPTQVDQNAITINNTETVQTKLRADAQFQDSSTEMFLHISEAVELGSDFVVAVGGYLPTLSEEANIIQLMESVKQTE